MSKNLVTKIRGFLHGLRRSVRMIFKLIVKLEKDLDNEEGDK